MGPSSASSESVVQLEPVPSTELVERNGREDLEPRNQATGRSVDHLDDELRRDERRHAQDDFVLGARLDRVRESEEVVVRSVDPREALALG